MKFEDTILSTLLGGALLFLLLMPMMENHAINDDPATACQCGLEASGTPGRGDAQCSGIRAGASDAGSH